MIFLVVIIAFTTLYTAYRIIILLFEDHIAHYSLFFKRKRLKKFDRLAIERIVSRQIPYYRKLSSSGKVKFMNRVIDHFLHKDFNGRRGMIVSREMKTLISVGAVKLTFGLRYYILKHFYRIDIYSDKFRIRKDYPEMHGATIPSGIILFNWQMVKDGFLNNQSGVNLAIHEYAHALVVQHRQGVMLDSNWIGAYERWFALTVKELKKYRKEEERYFRRDLLKTPTEMFPVIVEEFFERPEALKVEFPVVYSETIKLLNQDPMRISHDYKPIRSWFS